MAADDADTSDDGGGSWAALPQHVLMIMLSYLTPHQRLQAALTCRAWTTCLQHPLLWRRFVARFLQPNHTKVLSAVEHHGHRIRYLIMEVDQAHADTRKSACKALNLLAMRNDRRLTSVVVRFIGENPYFYAGQEFLMELRLLFGCVESNSEPFSRLTHVDLSKLPVALDDSLFEALAECHPDLEFLNIQNTSLVCKVAPTCMLRLVSRCRKLRDLRVFHLSLTDDILTEIAGQRDPPLQNLSILYRRETKYAEDLSSAAWSMLVGKLPSLRVTLRFDHTCPLNRVGEVMKPEIPVTELRLDTFTDLYEEVNLATTSYHRTLKSLELHTNNSEPLGRALLRMAQNCHRLDTLKVYCVIGQDIIDQILDLHPRMRQAGSFILKATMEEGPWVVGAETNEEARQKLMQQQN